MKGNRDTALVLSKHATPSGFNWVNKQCPDIDATTEQKRIYNWACLKCYWR